MKPITPDKFQKYLGTFSVVMSAAALAVSASHYLDVSQKSKADTDLMKAACENMVRAWTRENGMLEPWYRKEVTWAEARFVDGHPWKCLVKIEGRVFRETEKAEGVASRIKGAAADEKQFEEVQ